MICGHIVHGTIDYTVIWMSLRTPRTAPKSKGNHVDRSVTSKTVPIAKMTKATMIRQNLWIAPADRDAFTDDHKAHAVDRKANLSFCLFYVLS